jgi:hypothetical protein
VHGHITHSEQLTKRTCLSEVVYEEQNRSKIGKKVVYKENK